jgi:hypothetical protein
MFSLEIFHYVQNDSNGEKILMGLASSGIYRVSAFGLAAGVRAGGSAIDEPLSVLVKWRSGYEDKLYQIYVNGELASVTTDLGQRGMIMPVLSSWSSAVRIEVFAVEPSEAHIDFSSQLPSRQQAGRIRLSWLRSMVLPFEGIAQVYSDGRSGEIDYESPVSKEDIQLWPSWQDKFGFGLGQFGEGDFGYEGSAAVGFGMGLFGEGEFGFDADKVIWESDELETGRHKFAVKVTDRFGQVSDGEETGEITVIRSARPAEGLKVDFYDKAEDRLALCIS